MTEPAKTAFATEPPPWTCPRHGRALRDLGDELRCPDGDAYPKIDGIPRFVGDGTYSDAFGVQWRRYRRTQLDSYSGTRLSYERARRCLGAELFDDLAARDVLECGCGAGRFTEVLLARGARVTSVDLSSAVEANKENFPQNDRHRIAQADLADLPFAPRQFDVVFCLGVVQHTPSPEQAIARLYDQVRPGGTLAFDHYSRRLHWWLSSAPLWREVLRRLPPERGLAVTERLVRIFFPLHRRAGRLGFLLRRISPVQTYFHAIPELSDEQQYEWALLDTHDALTDWYKHFRSQAAIEAILAGLGLTDITVREAGNGVEARGRRPQAA